MESHPTRVIVAVCLLDSRRSLSGRLDLKSAGMHRHVGLRGGTVAPMALNALRSWHALNTRWDDGSEPPCAPMPTRVVGLVDDIGDPPRHGNAQRLCGAPSDNQRPMVFNLPLRADAAPPAEPETDQFSLRLSQVARECGSESVRLLLARPNRPTHNSHEPQKSHSNPRPPGSGHLHSSHDG